MLFKNVTSKFDRNIFSLKASRALSKILILLELMRIMDTPAWTWWSYWMSPCCLNKLFWNFVELSWFWRNQKPSIRIRSMIYQELMKVMNISDWGWYPWLHYGRSPYALSDIDIKWNLLHICWFWRYKELYKRDLEPLRLMGIKGLRELHFPNVMIYIYYNFSVIFYYYLTLLINFAKCEYLFLFQKYIYVFLLN